VSGAALHTLLPAGWQSSPFNMGPSKDANVTVTFVHPIVAQGPEGQPQDLIEIAAVGLMAKRTGTDTTVPPVFAGFASKPSYVPGPYAAFELAKATVEQNVRTDPTRTSSVHESWAFSGDNAKRHPTRAAICSRARHAGEDGSKAAFGENARFLPDLPDRTSRGRGAQRRDRHGPRAENCLQSHGAAFRPAVRWY